MGYRYELEKPMRLLAKVRTYRMRSHTPLLVAKVRQRALCAVYCHFLRKCVPVPSRVCLEIQLLLPARFFREHHRGASCF